MSDAELSPLLCLSENELDVEANEATAGVRAFNGITLRSELSKEAVIDFNG